MNLQLGCCSDIRLRRRRIRSETGLRVAVTTMVSRPGPDGVGRVNSSRREAGTSVRCAAKPLGQAPEPHRGLCRRTKDRQPFAELVFYSSGTLPPGSSSSTWAPATAADWGSRTFDLRSAAEAAVTKTRTETRPAKKRIHFSFATRKGWSGRFARVSWLRSKGGPRPSPSGQTGLPGDPPVAGAISSLTVARQRGFSPASQFLTTAMRTREPKNCERTKIKRGKIYSSGAVESQRPLGLMSFGMMAGRGS